MPDSGPDSRMGGCAMNRRGFLKRAAHEFHCWHHEVFMRATLTVAFVAAFAHAAFGGQSSAGASVTFSKDVAPILQKSCQHCHRPGAIAPMSLLTYQDA